LAILEGEGLNMTDVTFGYNANFFLFATLESARQMAHGRVQPPPQQVPVLTGMPVSGMAYLDRPTEAGYFIFPDLSVRHEGKYKLSFNLYEQTKHENDTDAEPSNEQKPKPAGMTAPPDSSFDWRLEVKSAQFTVFSAKKFPGLAESTNLSRTIAEQGCRVRIRRDVRMRRREDKPRDYEEDEYSRIPHTPASVQEAMRRSRSRSLSSEGEEFGPGQAPGSLLNFIPQSQGQPQFAHPQMPPQPQQAYQPRPYEHPTHHYNRPGAPVPSNSYGPDRNAYPQSAYPSFPPREREYEMDSYRRASLPAHVQTSIQPGYPHPLDTSFNRNSGYVGNPAPILPPLRLGQKYEDQTSPQELLTTADRLPSFASPTYERTQDRQYGQYPTPLVPEAAPRNGKRSYDSVFASRQEPLYNGMRPDTTHQEQEDDESQIAEAMIMSYRRAGGEQVNRDCPVASE
jgi:hypothetical protein